MNKSQIELDLLLDLFEAGYKNAYVSSMDLFNGHGSHLTRLEIVLQNVGRICLFQNFIELDGGEQVPNFTVFYNDAVHPNIRTKITDRQSLGKSVTIAYKTKKYMETAPENLVRSDNDLFERTKKNSELAIKLYERHIKKRIPFFQMLYKQK